MEIHNLTISISGIQNLFYQASVQFGDKYEDLKQCIKDGKITHADETSWRMNGQNWWTWLWCNDKVTLYTTEDTRGQGIPEKMLEKFKGLLIRDAFNSYNIVGGDQQVCWTHLLRKAHEYCEREKSSEQMVILKDTLKSCYRRLKKWHKKKHTKEERIRYHDRMRQMFIDLSERKTWTEKDVLIFIREWIHKQKNRLVTFLKYEGSSPSNNYAERCIKPMVLLRKITGGSKSKRGVRATDINMSIIETWLKQGYSILHDLPGLEMALAHKGR